MDKGVTNNAAGADCLTLGNHAWDQKEALVFIERAPRLIRPVNYPKGTPGRGAAVLDAVDTVAVVSIVSWPYPDPGALLARRLGLGGLRRTMTTTVGGNSPQLLVNTLAPMIERGDADVVLLGGAECVYTRWRARRDPKAWLPWTSADDPPCPVVIGDDRPGNSDYEVAHGAAAPVEGVAHPDERGRGKAGRGQPAGEQGRPIAGCARVEERGARRSESRPDGEGEHDEDDAERAQEEDRRVELDTGRGLSRASLAQGGDR